MRKVVSLNLLTGAGDGLHLSGREYERTCGLRYLLSAAGATLLLLGCLPAAAQTPAATSSPRPIHHRAHKSVAHLPIAPAPLVLAPIPPPPPPPPDWPANDRPNAAAIVWDSAGLSIEATNSSLQQILKEVSTATGSKVEGLAADQRVYGYYGPGPAREVLSELMQGSGYNVLMIGDLGQGTPREILLSVRHAGDAQPANPNPSSNNDEDNDADEQQAAPPQRPDFSPGDPPRTPQQIMQEMQERQRMQQPNNPPN